MTILDAAAIGLAGMRLALLLATEDGPFDLAARWRRLIRADIPGPQTGLAKLFGCLWCLSVWTTIAWAGVWYAEPDAVYVAAATALIPLVEVLTGRNSPT